VTIETRILVELQKVIHSFETSISEFQAALNSWTHTSDLRLMFLKQSKMGVDGLLVDAVVYTLLHQN
jgi:hypothetical protein